MSSLASPASRRDSWRAVFYGVGGYVLASAVGVIVGPSSSGYEPITGDTITAALAVIGPLGGLAGTTFASRQHRGRHLTSYDLALLWCAATAAVAICVYVYLRVDQTSTVTGLITGAAALRVMRMALLERTADHGGPTVPGGPTMGRLRAHHR